MTCRLSDLDGRTWQFRLLGFKRTEPPRLIVTERGPDPEKTSWHYFILSGQRAGGALLEYREVPPVYAHESELGSAT